MRRAWAVAALLALSTSTATAASYHAPPLTGHVVDPTGLISPADNAALNRRMEDIRARSGFELVAFVVGALDDIPIEDVAYGAFNQWGIGRAGKDNGVLLVIAPKERKVRIETGKGVGGALTDVQSSDIIVHIIAPLLRQGRYAPAVAAGVDAIAATLSAGTVVTAGAGAAAPRPLSWRSLLIGGGALVLFILLLILSRGFRSAMWSAFQFFLLFRFLGGGRGSGGGGGGYVGGGGASGGGGATSGY